LFGDDAFVDPDDPRFLKPAVQKFVDIVMVNTWNRFRKLLKHENTRLVKMRQDVESLWKGALFYYTSPILLLIAMTHRDQRVGHPSYIC
jgi:hypothetical protein